MSRSRISPLRKSPITRWLTWEAIALLTIFVIVVLTEGLSLRAQEASVNPGINNNFLNPDLDAANWVQRFEIESREVFSARHDVAEVMAIQPGDKIADVGAGTGFYAKLFSETTGEEGWVYAVDIAPAFLQHINTQAAAAGITNLTSVLGGETSINLPPESVNIVFTCDTYHHFEYPAKTMASIHRALKPGGTFVIIDFKRIEGESSDFIMNHVRAGQDVFRSEIEAAGFELIEDIDLPSLEDNYLMRFRKVSK